MKSPRIPEPGKYGVVRDFAGYEWVRTGPTQDSSYEWLNAESGMRFDFSEIAKPVLVRPGMEDSR